MMVSVAEIAYFSLNFVCIDRYHFLSSFGFEITYMFFRYTILVAKESRARSCSHVA